MNLNCETQKIGFCETVYESTAEQSLDADISLPDYCPEIQRILKCTVCPEITGVQNNSGRVTADANAVVRILYVGDNGKISGYEQNYPIQKFIESSKITSESAVNVKAKTDYVNCRAVNPRRIDIRAMMSFSFKAMKKRDEEILCSSDGAGIQTLTREYDFASLTGVCERAFNIGEVIELSGDKPAASQIVNISACAVSGETKIINNKALIKGECTVKIYYIGDESGSVESVEHSMPISQIAELDGINENCISALRLDVSSCEGVLKADSSGDMRLIDINARLSLFMASFAETPLTVITDAYSTEYEVRNTPKSMELLTFNSNFDTSFTNKVVLESIGVSVDNVIAVWCSDLRYSFAAKEDKCMISGTYQANIVYRDSENQAGVIQKPIDFDYSVKLKEKADRISCHGSVQISGCSCAVTGDSRLELKTELLLSGIVLSSSICKYVGSIELSGENDKREKPCALTIYFCEKGESLWNIARRYGTTVDAIMQENNIDCDVTENGGMMLIPGV